MYANSEKILKNAVSGPGIAEKMAARFVMIGAAMIGFSGVYVKLAHVGPTVSAFYRVLIGGILLLAWALVRRQRLWAGSGYFLLQLLCGFIFAMDLFVWHRSVIFVGPGLATILGNFQVFILASIGILVFGERMSWRLALSIPIAVTGLFLVVGIQWGSLDMNFRAGVGFGLLTALCYTGYTLSLRRLQSSADRTTPSANLAVVSLITALFSFLLILLEGDSLVIPDARSVIALGAYGLFSQVVGWVLISKGLPGVRASLAGLLLLLQPLLAFIWDMVFFGCTLTVLKLTGTLMTLLAIYLGSTRRSKT